jgi:preprotein translocase subunit YajC
MPKERPPLIATLPVLAATEPATQQPQQSSFLGQYGIFLIMAVFVVIMWMMSRRNKKKQDAQVDFRKTLAPGQRVQTVGGMIAVVTAVQGEVVTLMSPSGDESAFIKRAIRSLVPDEEWEAMIADYPDPDDVEEEEVIDEDVVDDDLDAAQGDADDDVDDDDDEGSEPEDDGADDTDQGR